MNLHDLLCQSSDETVRKIALENNLLDPHENHSKIYLINLIMGLFTNIERLTVRVINLMENEVLDALIEFAFKNEITNKAHLIKLHKRGFFINGSMPDDVRKIIQKYGRNIVVKQFNTVKIKRSASKFIVFTLLLNYFQIHTSLTYPKKKNDKQIKELAEALLLSEIQASWIKDIIERLINERFLVREKNKLHINETVIQIWAKEDLLSRLKNFYLREAKYDQLKNIAKWQGQMTEWVDTEYLPAVTTEYERLSEAGLIHIIIQNKKQYVQLSPEGWYLVKEQYPDVWLQKNVIITADFEMFIPSFYDPDFVLDIHNYCELKDNEYFLVYELDLGKKKIEGFTKKQIYRMISNSARFIPDVVKYEFEH